MLKTNTLVGKKNVIEIPAAHKYVGVLSSAIVLLWHARPSDCYKEKNAAPYVERTCWLGECLVF